MRQETSDILILRCRSVRALITLVLVYALTHHKYADKSCLQVTTHPIHPSSRLDTPKMIRGRLDEQIERARVGSERPRCSSNAHLRLRRSICGLSE